MKRAHQLAIDAQQPGRILIILPRQLGDILLGSSLSFALRQSFPSAHISWLSHPMGRQLLTGHPALNEVRYHPVWKGKPWRNIVRSPLGHALDFLKHVRAEINFLRQIRAEKFDLIVDSICTPRTAILARWSGASQRFGLKTRWNRDWAYTWLCETKNWSSLYAAKARLALLKPLLGAEKCENPPAHWLDSWIPSNCETKNRIDLWLDQEQLQGKTFVLLSPTHRRLLRRWPAQAYVTLALRLAKEFNWHIVWLWGPGELDLVKSAHELLQNEMSQQSIPKSFSILPPLFTLPEVAELSGRAHLWIGNSNGLSHVAVAGGAKTVQIHGPTTPAPWTHPDKNKHIALQRSEGCLRCESNVCRKKTHECLQQLTVDEVFAGVLQLKTASKH